VNVDLTEDELVDIIDSLTDRIERVDALLAEEPGDEVLTTTLHELKRLVLYLEEVTD